VTRFLLEWRFALLLFVRASLGQEFPSVSLEVIGDGPERSCLEKASKGTGLGAIHERQSESAIARKPRETTMVEWADRVRNTLDPVRFVRICAR